MKLGFSESTSVEFKREYVSDINKTIIAFANTHGGTIYIGVADDATVVGVPDADKTCVKVTNTIRSSISPDLLLLVYISIEKHDSKDVIKVDVQRGAAIPYFLKGKGLTPQAVFLRHGTSSVPATEDAFLRIIRSSGPHEDYESLSSLNQNLTFQEAAKAFAAEAVPFDENHKVSLGIKNCDGAYTNLGLLLSDQNQLLITMGVFQGTDVRILRNRVVFSGSLLKQLEDTEQFIDFRNATAAEFEGLYRIDIRDYPPEAVREVILNLLMHRDHSCPHDTQIKMFSDRIEFVSFGSLPEGMTMERMKSGISIPRNRKLAEIFLRLKLIEKMGMGIKKIEDSYGDYGVKPDFFADDLIFRVILPNINEARLKPAEIRQKKPAHSLAAIRQYSREEIVVLALFEANEYIGRKDVEEALTVSRTTASRYLNMLVNKGDIAFTGGSKNIRYYLNKDIEKRI